MIKLSKEKVLLLHKLLAEATGGAVGVRDEELVHVGLSVADGSMGYEALLQWVKDHEE